jgi:pimeloyl-ACP methyl ester carboxylesterase
MERKDYNFGKIPAVVYGDRKEKGYLFIHGQGGSKKEAEAFAQIALPKGFQVIGIDLPGHGERKDIENFNPWTGVAELSEVIKELQKRWKTISIRANSIGAYFAMLAFKDDLIEKALFVSPIVDMEKLIKKMMGWAKVDLQELKDRGNIPTSFGQTLSWNYLNWVKDHPLSKWETPTSILYGSNDNLTDPKTIESFAKKHQASLTIIKDGEHWFHTPSQLLTLQSWETDNI